MYCWPSCTLSYKPFDIANTYFFALHPQVCFTCDTPIAPKSSRRKCVGAIGYRFCCRWTADGYLSIKYYKTVHMSFAHWKHEQSTFYLVSNSPIQTLNIHKDLGACLSEKLAFNLHPTTTAKIAWHILGIIRFFQEASLYCLIPIYV